MERDWSYFGLIGFGVVILWFWHRRRRGQHGGLIPVVAGIVAIIVALYVFFAK